MFKGMYGAVCEYIPKYVDVWMSIRGLGGDIHATVGPEWTYDKEKN